MKSKNKNNQTQTQTEVQNNFHALAEENLKLIAENLNIYLKENKKLTLQEQNIVSAIIHKYTTSYTQLQSINFKKRELYIKEQNLNLNFKGHDFDYGPFPFPKSPDSQDSESPSSTAQDNPPENSSQHYQSPTNMSPTNITPPHPPYNGSYGYSFDLPKFQLPTQEMIEQAERDLGLM